MRERSLRRPRRAGLWAACAGSLVACAPLPDPPAGLAPVGAPPPASRCGAPAAAPALDWPAGGEVSSGFGRRGGRHHRGIDISGHYGRGVRAAAAGEVIFSGSKRGYGRVVILRHAGGLVTVYAHNQDNFARRGARVERGQLIADMGSSGHASGPHLHFEVRIGERALDPLACLPVRTTRR